MDLSSIAPLLAKLQALMAMLPDIVTGVVGVLTALIALALMIPGEQPEKALQGIVDVLKKFSRK